MLDVRDTDCLSAELLINKNLVTDSPIDGRTNRNFDNTTRRRISILLACVLPSQRWHVNAKLWKQLNTCIAVVRTLHFPLWLGLCH